MCENLGPARRRKGEEILGLRTIKCRERHTAKPRDLDHRTTNSRERLRHAILLNRLDRLHARMRVELGRRLRARHAQPELLESLWHKLNRTAPIEARADDKVVRVHVAQRRGRYAQLGLRQRARDGQPADGQADARPVQVRVRDEPANDFEAATDVKERRWMVLALPLGVALALAGTRALLDRVALAALVKRHVIHK